MNIEYYLDFKIELPFADGVFWNGRPGEYSNIPGRLNYTQSFGHTPFSQRGVYGYFNGKPRPHNGHDFAGHKGTPVVAPTRLWVTFMGQDPGGYGNFVFAETESKKVNGKEIKIEFVFAHLDKIKCRHLSWLKKGEIIGAMGSTGFSTGPHLHFGGRPLLNGKWAFPDDGARGYIDLTPLFITKPIFDKQILINMDKFKKEHDTKLIFNNKTGEIGWLYNGKLRVPSKERTAQMIASYLVRKEGVNASDDMWNILDKTNF